jgi:hypothetical protein
MVDELKAGTVDDFESSLAAYIDQAMQNEWLAVKKQPMPNSGPGVTDRQILFAAIAQGVLKFLVDHGGDLITSTDSGDGGLTTHRHTMAFSVGNYREPLP